MRKIREVLRLKFEARLAHRVIAAACGIGAGAALLRWAELRTRADLTFFENLG